MAKGILYVASRPKSVADAESYHHWYETTHLQEMTGIEGFRAARRYAPLSGEGEYVAIYEIEADDIEAVQARLAEKAKAGEMSEPVGVSLDPPPVVRFYREIATHIP